MRGQWRKLHNEEFHGVHCLSNNIRATKSCKMRWVRNVAHMAAVTTSYKIFPQKSRSRGPFGKSRHVLVDDIRVCPKELGCRSVEWMQLVHVNVAVKLWVPQKERNFLNNWDNCGFCRLELARTMYIGRSAAVTCHCQWRPFYKMWRKVSCLYISSVFVSNLSC